jgi:hypothetical protein
LKNRNITIYVFYGLSKESRRNDCDIYKIAIYLTTVKISLPPKYEDYRDIFFPIEYIKITKNSQIAHTINLEKDIIASYKLIYHFSEKELRVLREYFEEN